MNKYENRIIAALRGKGKPPMSPRELAKKLGVKKGQREQLQSALAGLMEQGKIALADQKYLLVESAGLIPAEIVKVTATFGFARVVAESKDIFVPGRKLMGTMPGDQVLVRCKQKGGQLPEGEVVQITRQSRQKFSGVARCLDGQWVVAPDSYVKFPILLHRDKRGDAADGEKVVARLENQGERHSDHLAAVLERFGDADSARACCRAVLAAQDIFPDFPPEVLEQAAAVTALEGIHPKELAQRLDLRGEPIFTIDGADSKDLDDAVGIAKHEDGWELGVHIADVSYFVTHQSPLDLEAFRRGTSVYYADSVVPMLPPALSNGICSLNPGEDRLAFSVLLSLDREGELRDYRFAKTVIRSRVKGIYSEVNAILEGTASHELRQKYAGLEDNLRLMRELAALLSDRRRVRGGVNLESVEGKITLDDQGRAIAVAPRERGISEQIIEEFMLTANQAAARLALSKDLPFVYRIHESPAPDRLQSLYLVLDRLGIPVKQRSSVTAKQLSDILCKAADTRYHKAVNALVLRSMAKARYCERNTGHFGLALSDYAHFTSPIRRYPDLVIHRILSGYVTGMRMENIRGRFEKFAAAALRATDREIASMNAERGCEDCYKAEYMRGFIGQSFGGVISGVTSFGVYVQLENTVEGLVSIDNLPSGDWEFDGLAALTDRLSGGRLQLGDAMEVKVLAARVSAGQVDFGAL